MDMKANRRLLLVEDSDRQARSLRSEFEEVAWSIIRAHDRLSAVNMLKEAAAKGSPVDAVALDLGLPPYQNSPLETGLPLAIELRVTYPHLPMLAYTSLPAGEYMSRVVAELLPRRISFIALRALSDHIKLAQLLEFAWLGFVLLSPAPADYLPDAIAITPDPLSSDLWETLRLFDQGATNEEVARALPITGDGVRARLRRTALALVQTHELEEYETTRDDLLKWYRTHRVRYRRR